MLPRPVVRKLLEAALKYVSTDVHVHVCHRRAAAADGSVFALSVFKLVCLRNLVQRGAFDDKLCRT